MKRLVIATLALALSVVPAARPPAATFGLSDPGTTPPWSSGPWRNGGDHGRPLEEIAGGRRDQLSDVTQRVGSYGSFWVDP
jgi:hypothetical protein